jgi:hypothetical protein
MKTIFKSKILLVMMFTSFFVSNAQAGYVWNGDSGMAVCVDERTGMPNNTVGNSACFGMIAAWSDRTSKICVHYAPVGGYYLYVNNAHLAECQATDYYYDSDSAQVN